MKIVLAPDKFKNSLTGMAFCQAVEAGIHAVNPDIDILKLPLADGGDGTIEVVNFYLNGRVVEVDVSNPFFEPIKANFLYAEASKTAFIEMAEASGLKLLKRKDFDCKNATTLGTGDMILDALNKGARTIILGIGGSATNDCGIGMATALGYRFLDEKGKEVVPTGFNLLNIRSIDATNVHPNISEVNFKIACDVTNPLYGEDGAAYVYATQKGAKARDIILLDDGLKSFAKILQSVFGVDAQSIQGAGAAGGMGIASKVFLNGTLERGIELIKDLAQFDKQLHGADWIITGEGKLDTQTMSGKTIQGVLSSAKAKQIKVAAFCGSIDLENDNAKDFGIEYTDAVIKYSKSLNDAMKNSYGYVEKMATTFARQL
ncbi:glycerate kinase [Algibacter lectus]|uniref:Glycerate kinase n=1 Tax=Algibacter lectus TaxID=221126 RepID=A0A4R8MBL3_9FLAO|nr:glycerate kinase [Algibacter lectus]MWW24683.1 glycerate kinase [Algibacter lectus]TDY62704.1 glycerate kinase [Algibacter lectus]